MVLTESGQNVKIGGAAPNFSLPGIDGKIHSAHEYAGSSAVLIIFMCNHCPYVVAKAREMARLHKLFSPKGVKLVGINSNDKTSHPEDSFENMKKFAKENGIEFDYLRDESQETAKAYGATCTPDPFLFNSDLRLAWHGRLDDAHGPGKAPAKFDMQEAIEELLAKGKVSKPFLPSLGCNIKWK